MALFAQNDIALPIATAAIAALGAALAAVLPVWLKLRHERITRETETRESQEQQESLETGASQLENQLVSTLTRLEELAVRVSQLESQLSASQRLVSETRKQPTQPSKVYFLTGPRGADAQGGVVEGGFLVRKDSSVATDMVTSMPRSYSKLRAQLLADGVLAKRGERITFTKDHQFLSPSAAAGVVVGGSVNGLKAWKDADGGTLGDGDTSVDKAG